MISHWVRQSLHFLNKRWLAAVVLPLVFSSLYAGVLPFGSDVQMVQTEYFDIIYPAESSAAAKILVDAADALYLKACQELGSVPYFRMPVVITPVYDSLNAYFTMLPYNRIVVYDTPPDASLAVFSETLKEVFYHELVHAVSLNMKGNAFRSLGTFLGDWLNPAYLTLPTLFTEGAAVALESRDGQGRLNDGFSTHIFRQAKLEGKFPSWRDAAGARDVYPSDTIPYLFGGAFTRWLVETYGQQMYTNFLYSSARIHFFKLTAGIFKQIYGVSLGDAWREFQSSVFVPEIPKNPIHDDSGAYRHEPVVGKQGLYRSLTSSSAGVAWIDSYSSTVCFQSAESGKVSKLVQVEGLSRVSLSSDGVWVALSRSVGNTAQGQVLVLHRESGRSRVVPQPHLRDGIVMRLSDGALYVAAVLTEGQECKVLLFPLDESDEGDFSVSEEAIYEILPPEGTPVFSLVDAGGGVLGFVGGGMSNSICLVNPVTGAMAAYGVPDSVRADGTVDTVSVRGLSAVISGSSRDVTLAFSWADSCTFPRIGFIRVPSISASLSDASLHIALVFLSDGDVSGGVYSPVHVSDGVFQYSAHFYEYDLMMRLDAMRLGYTVRDVPRMDGEPLVIRIAGEGGQPSEQQSELIASVPYSPFRYILGGAIFPVPLVQEYDYDLNPVSMALLGASWVSSDPAERAVVLLSGGYNPFDGKWGLGTSVTAGGFSGSLSAFFCGSEFSSASANGGVSLSADFGRFFSFGVADSAWCHVGAELPQDDTLVFTARNMLSLQLSSLRKAGKGYYNARGFSAVVFLDSFCSRIDDVAYNNLGVSYSLRVGGYVPLAASVALFPDKDCALNILARAYLVSLEVQRALPLVPLYLNRIGLSVGYEGEFERQNNSWDIMRVLDIACEFHALPYYDSAFVRLEIMSSLNESLLTGTRFSVYGDLLLRLRYKDNGSMVSWRLGGNISL